MTSLKKFIIIAIFGLCLSFIFSTPTIAGNPLYMADDNQPLIWDTTQTIKYKIDPKGLGQLSYSDSVAIIQLAMSVWENVAGTNIQFEFLGNESESITPQNWESIAANNIYAKKNADNTVTPTPSQQQGYLVIGFDNTGEILAQKGSAGASGAHSLTAVKGTHEKPEFITSGHLFINGLFYDGDNEIEQDLSLVDLFGILVHELGHVLGLDHSLFNYEIYRDIINGNIDPSYARYIPTMFPRFIQGSGEHMASLHPDDIATLLWLYGNEEHPTISGEILDANENPVETMTVTIRNTQSPLCEAYSQNTSILCANMNSSASGTGTSYFNAKYCMDEAELGTYQIPVIETGAYLIDVQEIPEQFDYAIARFDYTVRDIPGNAEFYNFNDTIDESYLDFSLITFLEQNLIDKNIVLSDTITSQNDIKRIDYTYFENSVYLNSINDDDDYCPLYGNLTENDILNSMESADFSISNSSETTESGQNYNTSSPLISCSLNSQTTAKNTTTPLLFALVMLLFLFRFFNTPYHKT